MRSPTYPHQWPPSSGGSGHWMGGGGGGSVYRHQLLNPSPSSLGMQPHHIRQQQLNTSWVNEMEQRRIMEQMAMLQQEKERQKYQQQQIQRVKNYNHLLLISLNLYLVQQFSFDKFLTNLCH